MLYGKRDQTMEENPFVRGDPGRGFGRSSGIAGLSTRWRQDGVFLRVFDQKAKDPAWYD